MPFQFERGLGQRQRIEAEFQETPPILPRLDALAGQVLDQLAQFSAQARLARSPRSLVGHIVGGCAGDRRYCDCSDDAGRSWRRHLHPVAFAAERISWQGDPAPDLCRVILCPGRLTSRAPNRAERAGEMVGVAAGPARRPERRDRLAATGELAAHERGQRLRGTHFDEQRRAVGQRVRDRIGETHRLAQLPAPVGRITRVSRIRRRSADAGIERARRRREAHIRERLRKGRQCPVHQRRMERMADLEARARDLLHLQHVRKRADSGSTASDDAKLRRIHRGQGDAVGKTRRDIARGRTHREHRAGWLRRHRGAARAHQRDRILEREHAGQGRGDVFANAVTDHRVGNDAPAFPQPRQCVFDREQRRLREARLGERDIGGIFLARRRQDQCAHVAAELRAGQRAAALEVLTEHHLGVDQLACHVRVLRALARKQEHEFRLGCTCRDEKREAFARLGDRARDDEAARQHRLAPERECRRDVRQLRLAGARQIRRQFFGATSQRIFIARRQWQHGYDAAHRCRCR